MAIITMILVNHIFNKMIGLEFSIFGEMMDLESEQTIFGMNEREAHHHMVGNAIRSFQEIS